MKILRHPDIADKIAGNEAVAGKSLRFSTDVIFIPIASPPQTGCEVRGSYYRTYNTTDTIACSSYLLDNKMEISGYLHFHIAWRVQSGGTIYITVYADGSSIWSASKTTSSYSLVCIPNFSFSNKIEFYIRSSSTSYYADLAVLSLFIASKNYYGF